MNNRLHKLIHNRLTIPFTPFYRRYPYRHGISINSADARGCIDIEHGFFCNRIPKAANSTIITTLAKISFGEEVPSRVAKKTFRAPSQLKKGELKRLDELFKFAVVRNPYTRTLSAYLDKIERWPERKKKVGSFQSFLHRLHDSELYSNAHWAPQSSLLLLPSSLFDYFGKVENLNDDLAFIRSRILGEKFHPEPVKSALGHATGAADKLSRFYDEGSVEMVRSLYKDDFELFNYPTEFPI